MFGPVRGLALARTLQDGKVEIDGIDGSFTLGQSLRKADFVSYFDPELPVSELGHLGRVAYPAKPSPEAYLKTGGANTALAAILGLTTALLSLPLIRRGARQCK